MTNTVNQIGAAVNRLKIKEVCECTDPGCDCGGRCAKPAGQRVYRIDMVDISGTAVCAECADDCYESGVFADQANDYS